MPGFIRANCSAGDDSCASGETTSRAAERELRGIALGRKSWLFAGSDRGGERAAVMYTLIQTARMNGIDPQAWLADVLARINDHAIHRLDEPGRSRSSGVNWRHDSRYHRSPQGHARSRQTHGSAPR
jgi:hypothetical protein